MNGTPHLDYQWAVDESFTGGQAWPTNGRSPGSSALVINGTPMHVYALRVHRDEETGQLGPVWDAQFEDELAALEQLNGGPVLAVQLPGLAGWWVIVVHPYGP